VLEGDKGRAELAGAAQGGAEPQPPLPGSASAPQPSLCRHAQGQTLRQPRGMSRVRVIQHEAAGITLEGKIRSKIGTIKR